MPHWTECPHTEMDLVLLSLAFLTLLFKTREHGGRYGLQGNCPSYGQIDLMVFQEEETDRDGQPEEGGNEGVADHFPGKRIDSCVRF